SERPRDQRGRAVSALASSLLHLLRDVEGSPLSDNGRTWPALDHRPRRSRAGLAHRATAASAGQQPMPAWARLLLGGATGLLLAVAVLFLNATALRDVQELPGTSLGTSQEPAVMGSHAFVRLDPGRTVHLRNAFCGVNGARVTVFIGQWLWGPDGVIDS